MSSRSSRVVRETSAKAHEAWRGSTNSVDFDPIRPRRIRMDKWKRETVARAEAFFPQINRHGVKNAHSFYGVDKVKRHEQHGIILQASRGYEIKWQRNTMLHGARGYWRSDLQRCVGSFLLYRRTRSWRNGEIILKDYRRPAGRNSKKKIVSRVLKLNEALWEYKDLRHCPLR